MKILQPLRIAAYPHHGAFHIIADWRPIHCAIAIDGNGWRLLDGQHNPVRIHFGFYRMLSQTVLVIGRFSFRLDRKKILS